MHELKNPLAIIDMALLAKNDLEKTSSYVTRAVNNMKAILERCVKADKLTEGNVSISKKNIEVNHFLRDMLSTQDQTDERVLFHGVGTLVIKTDEQLLGIMLGNLVDNAVRYGDQLVPVQIKTQVQSNSAGVEGVTITVSNPPGAASWPDADKVFKKYYRSTGAEAQSGTGLGLYLVRALATLLEGECRYVPDDTHINFELWLPS
jgi:K+-sensing histidine kinase KdpD